MNAPNPNPPPSDAETWLAGNQAVLAADLAWLEGLLHGREADASGRRAKRAGLASPAALDTLAELFGLSAFERDTLLLAAAPELNGHLAAAMRRAGHPHVSFAMALALLPEAHWSALDPEAALRTWDLVRPMGDGRLTERHLQVDERILFYLTGSNRPDGRLAEWLVPLPVPAGFEPVGSPGTPESQPPSNASPEASASTRVEHGVEGVEPLSLEGRGVGERVKAVDLEMGGDGGTRLAEALSDPAAPLPWLTGGDRTARRAALARAAGRLQAYGWRLVASALEDPDFDLPLFLRLWRREVRLAPQILGIETDGLDRLPARWAEALDRLPAAVVLSPAPLPFDGVRPLLPLALTESSHGQRLAAWQAALPKDAVSAAFLDALATGFRHPPEAVSLPASLAGPAAEGHLWQACLSLTRARLEGLAERIAPRAAWDDLVLPEEQRDLLRQLLDAAHTHARVADDWGYAARNARGLGVAALFAGPSGTGKTLAAEVVARELGLDLYRVDLARVVSKYIGETEKNLARIFDAAEAGGAVLLFDEADALFGKRSEVKDSHDRYANIEVAYLLQRMEAYRGLAILTSNAEGNLDAAFARRLRFVLRFPFPDQQARRDIWQRAFPPAAPVEGLDFDGLARLPLAGGSIANIAFAAACRAAAQGQSITITQVRAAARAECAKLERSWSDGWLGEKT